MLQQQINGKQGLPKSNAFWERGKATKRIKRSDENMTFDE